MGLNPTTPQGLPAEFNDILSQDLLLQPDPQYIFARMAYAAQAAQEARALDSAAFELAQLQAAEGRMTTGAGAPSNIAAALSNGMGGPLDLGQAVAYPDMIKMVAEAKRPGETIKINRPNFINGVTTPSSRQAQPGQKLFGTNSQPITMSQVAIEIVEYLGPLDGSGNASPLSLPSFMLNRAMHDLLSDLGPQLRRDRYRFLDDKLMNDMLAAALALGNATYPSGIASNAGFTGKDQEPISFTELVVAAQALKDRYIPGIQGSAKYLYIAPTNQLRQLKLDPQFQRLARYSSVYNPLFPGQVAEVDELVIVESNRMPTIANQGVGSNVTLYQGLILAPGAYGWGSAMEARTLRNRNDDGGRDNEFGWHAYEGLQILDDRFFQVIVTD